MLGPYRVLRVSLSRMPVAHRRGFHLCDLRRLDEFEISEETLAKLKSQEVTNTNLRNDFMDILDKAESSKPEEGLGSETIDKAEPKEPFSLKQDSRFTKILNMKPLSESKFTKFDDLDAELDKDRDWMENSAAMTSLKSLFETPNPPKKDQFIIINSGQIFSQKKKNMMKASGSDIDLGSSINLFDLAKHRKTIENSKTDVEEYFKAILSFKPTSLELYANQYDEVVNSISSLFTKKQLLSYVQSFPNTGAKTSKFTKKDYGDLILSKLWKVKKIEHTSSVKDLIREEAIPVTARELKLLLSDNGVIIFNWRSLGAEISIDGDQRLIVKLPAAVTRYIKIVMSNMLEGVQTAELDLQGFNNAENKELLDYLGSITNVVYEKDDNKISLFSLKDHRILTFKQLLLQSLNLNPFTQDEFIAELKGNRVEFNDVTSMPEIMNYKKWFRYQTDKTRKEVDEEIFDDITDYQTINGEISGLMVEQLALEPQLEDIEKKLFSREFEESVKGFKEQSDDLNLGLDDAAEVSKEVPIDTESKIDVIDVDEAYSKLGDTTSQVNISFGSLLVEESGERKVFHPHLAFINKLVSELPLYRDKHSPDKDNFDYVYLIKLMPNPYSKVSNPATYPPIEFWFETSGSKFDPKSLRMFVTRSEKNMIYSLPNYRSDLKISSTMLEELDTNLGKGEWLKGQSDVLRFLEDCGFSSHDFKESSIGESCKINIDGELVDYLIVGTQQRRQLELDYKGSLLQYSIVDNGHYGGKNLELIMVAPTGGREVFGGLVSHLMSLIGDM